LRHIALGWVLMAAIIILFIAGIIQPILSFSDTQQGNLPLTDFIITLSTSLIVISLILFFSYKSYPSYTAFGEASFSCEFGSA